MATDETTCLLGSGVRANGLVHSAQHNGKIAVVIALAHRETGRFGVRFIQDGVEVRIWQHLFRRMAKGGDHGGAAIGIEDDNEEMRAAMEACAVTPDVLLYDAYKSGLTTMSAINGELERLERRRDQIIAAADAISAASPKYLDSVLRGQATDKPTHVCPLGAYLQEYAEPPRLTPLEAEVAPAAPADTAKPADAAKPADTAKPE
jgi:hypothetical protein